MLSVEQKEHVYEDEDELEDLIAEAREQMEELAALLVAGSITLATFWSQMRSEISELYLAAAILGAGAELTQQQLDSVIYRIDHHDGYLDEFAEDLWQNAQDSADGRAKPYSEDRLIWRAGLYALGARAVWLMGKLPYDVYLKLPVMPTEDCLGGVLCGCSWWIEIDEEAGVAYCFWELGATEHCEVCMAHHLEWYPLEIKL